MNDIRREQSENIIRREKRDAAAGVRRPVALFCAVLMLLPLFLAGCSLIPLNFRSSHKTMIVCGTRSMSEQEVRLVSLYYKTEFESYYSELLGDAFWSMDAANEMTYEEYIKEYYIWEECRTVLCLAGIADQNGIRLTDLEMEKIDAAAALYFESLNEDELRYTGAAVDDVRDLLQVYQLAVRTVESILSATKTEISEEASRVCDIEVIRVLSAEMAETLLSRIEDGENFMTVAKENTIDAQIEYSVARGDLIPALDEVIFSMAKGDVSGVIDMGNGFCIIRVADTYNTLLSVNNRKNLLAGLKYDSWSSVCEEYASGVEIKRSAYLWERLKLEADGTFPHADLFAMFE